MDLVEFLPLNNKKLWIERINKRGSIKNRGELNIEPLDQKGYNIKDTAFQLENFYLTV